MSRALDLQGKVFGKLTALYRNGSKYDRAVWRFRCVCGTEKDLVAKNVIAGGTISCGCFKSSEIRKRTMLRAEDIKVGGLTPLGLAFIKKNSSFWNIQCFCGKVFVANGTDIKTRNTKSCGCLIKSGLHKTHGMSKTTIYRTWNSLHQRCKRDKNYIGRIRVVKRWNKFENFYQDMGDKPYSSWTIERINNNKDYGPKNCMWADRQTQNENKRNNLVAYIDGQKLNTKEMSKRFGMPMETLRRRFKEWKDWDRVVHTKYPFYNTK